MTNPSVTPTNTEHFASYQVGTRVAPWAGGQRSCCHSLDSTVQYSFCRAITKEDGFISTRNIENKATGDLIFLAVLQNTKSFFKIQNPSSPHGSVNVCDVGIFLETDNLCSFTKASKSNLFSPFQSKQLKASASRENDNLVMTFIFISHFASGLQQITVIRPRSQSPDLRSCRT